jgi:hypothetical protein
LNCIIFGKVKVLDIDRNQVEYPLSKMPGTRSISNIEIFFAGGRGLGKGFWNVCIDFTD